MGPVPQTVLDKIQWNALPECRWYESNLVRRVATAASASLAILSGLSTLYSAFFFVGRPIVVLKTFQAAAALTGVFTTISIALSILKPSKKDPENYSNLRGQALSYFGKNDWKFSTAKSDFKDVISESEIVQLLNLSVLGVKYPLCKSFALQHGSDSFSVLSREAKERLSFSLSDYATDLVKEEGCIVSSKVQELLRLFDINENVFGQICSGLNLNEQLRNDPNATLASICERNKDLMRTSEITTEWLQERLATTWAGIFLSSPDQNYLNFVEKYGTEWIPHVKEDQKDRLRKRLFADIAKKEVTLLSLKNNWEIALKPLGPEFLDTVKEEIVAKERRALEEGTTPFSVLIQRNGLEILPSLFSLLKRSQDDTIEPWIVSQLDRQIREGKDCASIWPLYTTLSCADYVLPSSLSLRNFFRKAIEPVLSDYLFSETWEEKPVDPGVIGPLEDARKTCKKELFSFEQALLSLRQTRDDGLASSKKELEKPLSRKEKLDGLSRLLEELGDALVGLERELEKNRTLEAESQSSLESGFPDKKPVSHRERIEKFEASIESLNKAKKEEEALLQAEEEKAASKEIQKTTLENAYSQLRHLSELMAQSETLQEERELLGRLLSLENHLVLLKEKESQAFREEPRIMLPFTEEELVVREMEGLRLTISEKERILSEKQSILAEEWELASDYPPTLVEQGLRSRLEKIQEDISSLCSREEEIAETRASLEEKLTLLQGELDTQLAETARRTADLNEEIASLEAAAVDDEKPESLLKTIEEKRTELASLSSTFSEINKAKESVRARIDELPQTSTQHLSELERLKELKKLFKEKLDKIAQHVRLYNELLPLREELERLKRDLQLRHVEAESNDSLQRQEEQISTALKEALPSNQKRESTLEAEIDLSPSGEFLQEDSSEEGIRKKMADLKEQITAKWKIECNKETLEQIFQCQRNTENEISLLKEEFPCLDSTTLEQTLDSKKEELSNTSLDLERIKLSMMQSKQEIRMMSESIEIHRREKSNLEAEQQSSEERFTSLQESVTAAKKAQEQCKSDIAKTEARLSEKRKELESLQAATEEYEQALAEADEERIRATNAQAAAEKQLNALYEIESQKVRGKIETWRQFILSETKLKVLEPELDKESSVEESVV